MSWCRTMSTRGSAAFRTRGFAMAALAAMFAVSTSYGQGFTRIVDGAPVNSGGSSLSADWGDFDADGDLDLHVANNQSLHFLYVNNGDGTFTERTDGVEVTTTGNTSVNRWADYDSDGDLDLFIANLAGSIFAFRNDDGSFIRIDDQLPESASTRHLSFVDFDNDGDLDLAATQRHGRDNLLFRNTGAGVLNRVTGGDFTSDAGDSVCLAWADVDDDGDLDAFVGNTGGESNYFYRNAGSGVLVRDRTAGVELSGGRTGACSWGDFDNDGDPDLFVGNVGGEENFLFENDGLGVFTPRNELPSTVSSRESHGSNWVDVDNDGDLDLAIVNQLGQSNELYLSDGKGHFAAVTNDPFVTTTTASVRAHWADYDRDGDIDVFIPNTQDEDNHLFRNDDASGNHWLHLALRGTVSNSFGVGTRVRLLASIGGSKVWQMRDLTGDVSNSVNGLEIVFGLGDGAVADSIVVRWPSGITQWLVNIAADQLLLLTEPRAILDHTPVDVAPPGLLHFRADISDETNSLDSVVVSYRPVGSSSFQIVKMTSAGGMQYVAEVTVTEEIEYYIQAFFDGFTVASASPRSPHRIGLLAPEPLIKSIEDVPNDQGGFVSLVWLASAAETSVRAVPFYSIWRAQDFGRSEGANESSPGLIGAQRSVGAFINYQNISWEWLEDKPSLLLPEYSATVATWFDRSETTDGWHKFMVVAHTSDPDIFYPSVPDSGFSINNSACVACNVRSEEDESTSTYLRVNYPNPFRLTTTISYGISEATFVSLIVYDVLGRPIRTLVEETLWPGRFSVKFVATDLPSGVYVYRLGVGDSSLSRRMLVVR